MDPLLAAKFRGWIWEADGGPACVTLGNYACQGGSLARPVATRDRSPVRGSLIDRSRTNTDVAAREPFALTIKHQSNFIGCSCAKIVSMKRPFSATVWREGEWFVSQCLDVDVASQGRTEEEALDNLREALELHFEPPVATHPPLVRHIEVEVGAA